MRVQLAQVKLNDLGHGSVYLDGQRIPGVRAVAVRSEAGGRAILTVEIVAIELEMRQTRNPSDGEVPDAAAHG
ncbi:hypothetical protein [Streptomyces sp. NPDC044948]|uniref:hypothetical protein n=1 Tax=Streptomyces sp. NPDC044948 TaxID=3157092 RepID=UPI0033E52CB4